MSATADHCRAGVLQQRLLARVDARPVLRRLPPSGRGRVRAMPVGGGALQSEARLIEAVPAAAAPDVAALLRSPEICALPLSLRRELVHRITACRADHERVGALVALFLCELDRRDHAEVDTLLELSRDLLRAPLLLGALPHLLDTPVYRALDVHQRVRVLRCFAGPTATDLCAPEHQATLDAWWVPRARELLLALRGPLGSDVTAEEAWRAHLYEPCRPLYLLTSAARPGLFVVSFGPPGERSSLSYGRAVFLDGDGRLRAMLRGPDRRIEGGWSDEADPNHPRYDMRRTVLTRDEELALVRWILDGHVVTARAMFEPAVFPRAAYDAILELDVRLPGVLAGLCSNRGEPVFDRGVVERGVVVSSEADEQIAFFRAAAGRARPAA